MHVLSSVAVEALLFCSLLLVIGVPVLYMTHRSTVSAGPGVINVPAETGARFTPVSRGGTPF